MKTKIVVAGATGHLGGLIISALLERRAEVEALVRTGTDAAKVEKLELPGVSIVYVDMTDIAALTEACRGASCVVSAMQGLRDVIVDMQSRLLDAAVVAGVPRFIPSDFASDFTKLPTGENRNFDLRREFKERLDAAPISGTSVLNGAFAEILSYNTPLLDLNKKTVGYWGSADWRMDFTTMKDTAAYTAAAAMDTKTPRILRIAGFQVSPAEMAAIAGEVRKETFALVRLGSVEDLAAYNRRERAAHPEGESEVTPGWQRTQYMQSMFSVQHESLDNNRYPNLRWTDFREFVASLA